MTMGEKILKLRKARGWNQEELAEKIGVTRQAVSRWEAGSAKPDVDKIVALCDLFGVSADYLLRDSCIKEMDKQESLQEKEVPELTKGRGHFAKSIVAWSAMFFSVVTLFILKLLSSVNPKTVGSEAIQALGSSQVSYSRLFVGFRGYIKYYSLEWLVWLAALMGITASLWLLCKWLQKLWA